jgi:hypothetical protein
MEYSKVEQEALRLTEEFKQQFPDFDLEGQSDLEIGLELRRLKLELARYKHAKSRKRRGAARRQR